MTQRSGVRYGSLYERLVANTHEPENDNGCWTWSAKCDRSGYGRVTVYVPGLRARVVLQAHVLLFVWLAAGCRCADDAYLAYVELQASGLEIDHMCVNPACLNPDHFEPVTPQQNAQRRGLGRARAAANSTPFIYPLREAA